VRSQVFQDTILLVLVFLVWLRWFWPGLLARL
jgi:hypothetical protein